mmetsp:Transcript_82924/g.230335  ORF Transcript_82924/g.230335 Transcript_82924/m.230335 type:complete len:273 (+) Transcript_82924:250-1068(+)
MAPIGKAVPHAPQISPIALLWSRDDVESPRAAAQGEVLPLPTPPEPKGGLMGGEIHEGIPLGPLVSEAVRQVEEVVGVFRPPLLDEPILRVTPWHIADGQCCRAGAEAAEAPLPAAHALIKTLARGWRGRPCHRNLSWGHGPWREQCTLRLRRCILLCCWWYRCGFCNHSAGHWPAHNTATQQISPLLRSSHDVDGPQKLFSTAFLRRHSNCLRQRRWLSLNCRHLCCGKPAGSSRLQAEKRLGEGAGLTRLTAALLWLRLHRQASLHVCLL